MVRALDANGDWIYGIGRSAYLTGQAEIAQDIQTALLSFLGNCFFDLGFGINWFGFIGGKDQIGLNLAISATILNVPNVTSLNQLSVTLDANRNFTIVYSANTLYGATIQQTVLLPPPEYLLTEDGLDLLTESGSPIITE